MSSGSKKKKQIQFRYYEIPQNQPLMALLGEYWIRPYGEGVDCLHFHNYMEIGFCYDGAGDLVLDEQINKYGPDMFTVIPKNFPHTTDSENGSLSRWEYMFIDVENFLHEIYRDNPIFADDIITLVNSRAGIMDVADYPEMAGLIRTILDEMREKKEFYLEAIRGLLLSLLMHIARMNRKPSSKVRNQTGGLTQIAEALDYISRHFEEDLTIGDLAVVSHMSETHFRRIFLKNMNMTPSDYLNMVRVHAACEYMKKHSTSMEMVAEKCGFQSVSTFNRNFKKIVGITPYQWKIHPENYEGKLLNFKISAYKGW
ncbi:MAG: helix-turn-helix transcriptional regulator [Lachnospiraceae bacterium]|nr:helix-turn-helix transcriptional regulator [Lachnospiraceae bacterium]